MDRVSALEVARDVMILVSTTPELVERLCTKGPEVLRDMTDRSCCATVVCVVVAKVVVALDPMVTIPLLFNVPPPTILTAIGTLVLGLGATGDTTLVVKVEGCKLLICSANAFILEIP